MAKPKPQRSAGKPRPEGELRQSQMITTYGPGALVDLVNDAILIPGLEHWSYQNAAGYEIHAPELADSLRRRGIKLSKTNPFRAPPVSRDDEQNPNCGIKAVEFPNWFVCPNPNCARLIHKRDTELKGGQRRHTCMDADRQSRVLIPVRFAIACSHGHLDDFPWTRFVHQGELCDSPELKLVDRGSGDLNDVYIHCTNEACKKQRSMGDARKAENLPQCQGRRPWLGAYVGDPSAKEECPELEQRLLIRTASGGYASLVESSLTIPKISAVPEPIREFFDRHDLRELSTLDAAEAVPMARKFIAVLKNAPEPIAKLSNAELWHHLSTFRAERGSEDETPPPVRETEYATMLRAPRERGNHLYQSSNKDEFVAVRPDRDDLSLPPGVADLVLVERLREVRTLTGFTRFEGASANIYGEFDQSRRAVLSLTADWLPAAEIRGEGFLLVLDPKALEAWEQRPAVEARRKQLYDGWVSRASPGGEFLGIRFYLLHTLAHLLITQVSLECGYAASAIRERIYCNPPNRPGALPMAGILLSTGSTGSEGTLGGLVQQGRRLAHHLEEALRRAKLCSHDPVCGRQHPQDGSPGRALLGAACHGCLFIAECSCERANQYLDRALVVPTMGLPDADQLAFFAAPTL